MVNRRILISNLELETAAGTATLSARIDAAALGWRDERLWFEVPADLASTAPHGDPFAVAMLLPAMAAGYELVIDGPVTPSLVDNLASLQSLLVAWNSFNPWIRFHSIRLTSTSSCPAPAGGSKTGLFFSGGMDSMYSLLRARHDTGHAPDVLLFVHGYDIPLGEEGRAATVLAHLSATARLSGHRLVVMRTNLRQFTDLALSWDMAHGAGLAAAGHAVSASFSRWLISSSDSHFRDGELSGTTSGIDPLWSREGLTFTAVGGHLDRQMKAEVLAGEAVAHRHLVVCWKAPAGITNCGRCAKCLRTMIHFLVLDALHRFETLPHDVPVDAISADSMLAEPRRIVHLHDMQARLSSRAEWEPLAHRIGLLIDRSERMNRGPRPSDLATRDGRMVAAYWARCRLERNLPVQLRRRLVPLYRRVRQGRRQNAVE